MSCQSKGHVQWPKTNRTSVFLKLFSYPPQKHPFIFDSPYSALYFIVLIVWPHFFILSSCFHPEARFVAELNNKLTLACLLISYH